MAGVVPPDLRLRARLGYVELDLTDATFAPGVTTIDVRAFLGYVQIRFPPGVHVESHGRALFGFFSLKGAPASAPDDTTRVVRIVGRATFGFAEGYTGS
jgi:predicted membrane protein